MKKNGNVAIGLAALCFMMMTTGAAWSGVLPNGTVTDGNLVWLKNANCFGIKNFNNALSSIGTLATGACGLSDGSKAGDWRLPSLDEMTRWYAKKQEFINVQQNGFYWSRTFDDKCDALVIDMSKSGRAQNCIENAYVMPVRAIK